MKRFLFLIFFGALFASGCVIRHDGYYHDGYRGGGGYHSGWRDGHHGGGQHHDHGDDDDDRRGRWR